MGGHRPGRKKPGVSGKRKRRKKPVKGKKLAKDPKAVLDAMQKKPQDFGLSKRHEPQTLQFFTDIYVERASKGQSHKAISKAIGAMETTLGQAFVSNRRLLEHILKVKQRFKQELSAFGVPKPDLINPHRLKERIAKDKTFRYLITDVLVELIQEKRPGADSRKILMEVSRQQEALSKQGFLLPFEKKAVPVTAEIRKVHTNARRLLKRMLKDNLKVYRADKLVHPQARTQFIERFIETHSKAMLAGKVDLAFLQKEVNKFIIGQAASAFRAMRGKAAEESFWLQRAFPKAPKKVSLAKMKADIPSLEFDAGILTQSLKERFQQAEKELAEAKLKQEVARRGKSPEEAAKYVLVPNIKAVGSLVSATQQLVDLHQLINHYRKEIATAEGKTEVSLIKEVGFLKPGTLKIRIDQVHTRARRPEILMIDMVRDPGFFGLKQAPEPYGRLPFFAQVFVQEAARGGKIKKIRQRLEKLEAAMNNAFAPNESLLARVEKEGLQAIKVKAIAAKPEHYKGIEVSYANPLHLRARLQGDLIFRNVVKATLIELIQQKNPGLKTRPKELELELTRQLQHLEKHGFLAPAKKKR